MTVTKYQLTYRQGDTRPTNLHYFAFRSALRASDLDDRWPDTVFSLDSILKLPQTFVNAAAPVVSNLASPLPIHIPTTDTADELETLQFEFGNLEENQFDSLSPADMRALLKRSASILVSSPPSALKKLKTNPSSLFGATPPSTTSLSQNIFVTPKIDRVFSSSTTGEISTYTGAANFLEDGNQAVFVSIFGTTPIPITLEAAKKRVLFEDTHTLKTKLRSFISLCELFILCSIVTRRYVGTFDFDRTAIIMDVEDALSQMKLEFRVRGQIQSITPDGLYREYQNYIPLLPDDAQDWSFHLVVLFLNALPVSLKKLVVSWGYKLPRLSDLSTAASRQHELEVLRESTVTAQPYRDDGVFALFSSSLSL